MGVLSTKGSEVQSLACVVEWPGLLDRLSLPVSHRGPLCVLSPLYREDWWLLEHVHQWSVVARTNHSLKYYSPQYFLVYCLETMLHSTQSVDWVQEAY